jgi:hypothetical protein
MIPFKFRDESGKILEITEFTKKGEDGKMMLDFDKIPKKLLTLFGFRIPTQERNSMAAVEIVGFLPETSGDLVLAPRDFTKQMGSDFDVDKLYTYMYNAFYDNGKLYTNFISDPTKLKSLIKIQRDTIEDLKEEFKLSKEDRKTIDAYIKEKLELTEDNETSEVAQKASEIISKSLSQDLAKKLDDAFNRLSVLNRSYKASKQNKILDIHLEIMTSNNPEIISSIIALDSFGEFDPLSKEIDKIRKAQNLVPSMGTILSETYQRTKFINATAGKNGVGSFSLDSTFNASVQGKDLVLQNLSEEEHRALFGTFKSPRVPTAQEILDANNPIASFGEVISKGDLSNKYTIRSQNIINKAKAEKRELTKEEKDSLKFKSTIIRALQSTAVDNEKEQILDKLNINDETFDVIRSLTLLGFEEKEIVGLITQEIIWEYVDNLRRSRSSLTNFDANAESKIVEELKAKYDSENRYAKLTPLQIDKLSASSGEKLMDNLANKKLAPTAEVIVNEDGTSEAKRIPTPDFNLEQIAILEKFRSLTDTGKKIKTLQSTINADSKGVPKSLIEVESKLKQIQNLQTSDIFNADKLLGKLDSYGNLVEPETLNGFATHYGTQFAGKSFSSYFPYKNQGFKSLVKEVQTHIPKGIALSSAKQTELQQNVFANVRSFLYANSNTNLFGDNPDLERRRLFIDSSDNMSLASILNSMQNSEWFQKNSFLNKLSFELNKNGTISRINFEAAAGENFDERNIYDGFSYLLSKDFPIINPKTPDGSFNGINYTSRTLAQDLVAAAFLEGGNQGAKQYLKYVPIAYLKSLGFGEYLNGTSFDFVGTFFGNVSDTNPIYTMPSAFTRQFFQNNPDQVKTLESKDINEEVTKATGEFTLTPDALKNNFVEVIDPATGDVTMQQTHFVSVYNSKEPSKYLLFEFDPVSRSYKKIPVLAQSYGFVAYNSEKRNSIPIESSEIVTTTPPQQAIPGFTITNIPVEPTKKFDTNVANNPDPTPMASTLPIDFSLTGPEAIEELFDVLEDAPGVSKLNSQIMMLLQNLELPEKFKIQYVNKGKEIRGGYDYDNDILSINKDIFDIISVDELATAINHELIHAFTGKAIKLYEAGKLDKLTDAQIKAIQELQRVQQLYINNIKATEGEAGVNAFIAKYNKWKKEGGQPTWSQEEISKYYGALKLSEFITMALTDSGFQNYLNSIPGENNRTLWDQIKDLLSSILNSMGLDINPNSMLATAIKDSMDVIEALQPGRIKPDEKPFKSGTTTQQQTSVINNKNSIVKDKITGKIGTTNGSFEEGYVNVLFENGDEIEINKKDLELVNTTQPTIQPVREVKEGVSELFESNPELATIGTQEQYSQYLETIFPDSKVKDIVYHGSPNRNILKFDKSLLGKNVEADSTQFGFYFTENKKSAEIYSNWGSVEKNGKVYPILLNIKNSFIGTEIDTIRDKEGNVIKTTEDNRVEQIKNAIKNNNDSVILSENGISKDIILVFEPEQIYMLGSNQDIEGFKKFVELQPNKISSTVTTQITPTQQTDTLENWEDYNNIQDLFDESITQSPINRDALEKYSLICGK